MWFELLEDLLVVCPVNLEALLFCSGGFRNVVVACKNIFNVL